MSSVNVFFEDKLMNPFIGAGALATVIDDFNGDNFDHAGLGFIGGAYIAGMITGGRPIEMIYTPPNTPTWGLEWKHAAAKNYLRSFSLSIHGSCMSARGNYLDLPTYRDIHGRPMLRMTFDFTENNHKMSDYLTDRAAEVAKAMNPREIKLNRRTGSWSVVPYQTTHNTGGAIMGDNPKTAWSTNICRPGMCPMFSRWVRGRFRKTPATTRQAPWQRSPTCPRRQSNHSTSRPRARW